MNRGRGGGGRRGRRPSTGEPHVSDIKDAIEVDGVIKDAMSNGFYNVEIANGHTVLARLAGKMTQGHIRVQPMDKVKVQLSVYDLSRGRIVWRFRE